MPELVWGESFGELFRSFARSAVRMETRPFYNSVDEREPLRRFLVGEPIDLSWFEPWLRDVRAATAAGREFRRVRLFSEPLADFLRYELWTCQFNVDAGEDIRYLCMEQAVELHLPTYDYWLFDDQQLGLMYFTNDGAPKGIQLVDDPAVVDAHRRWLEIATRHSIPYEQFAAEHPVSATAETMGPVG